MASLLLIDEMGGNPELGKILLEAVARPDAPRPMLGRS
jgi:hypothetical protein